jgi:predicted regulator of amino acid metabolism with ACT domain
MNYYIDLFSPQTATAFSKSSQDISGFRLSQKTYIQNRNIGSGDIFICYVTKIQRFIGALEVKSSFFVDNKPIFTNENDPFVLRFKVEPIVWLPIEKGIPIHEDLVWNKLSFTKNLTKESKDSARWAYMVFSSPKLWPTEDCEYLLNVLKEQAKKLTDYPFSENEQKKLKSHKIKVNSFKEVTVSVPDDEEDKTEIVTNKEALNNIRESLHVQAKLAEIGEKLGMKIWLPNNDRSRVLESWKPKQNNVLLEDLPLVFDGTTLNTIKNIDVLWIKRRSIIRAFEVEDKTSIYSGILRMADLLALQPMLDIKIHIVAPTDRREEVFRQISRPVFSVMEKGPLSGLCSYISYDSVYELSEEKRLKDMKDTIVDQFLEYFED